MKLMLGGVVVTAVAAWTYGFPRGGTLGTTGLIFAFASFLLLAVVTIAIRDANVSSMDPTAATESAAARPAPEASPWPVVGAIGAVLLVARARHLSGGVRVRHRDPARRGDRVDGRGVERAGVGRRRVQRRDPRARRQPGGVPGAGRAGARRRRLLLQPDHAVALGVERTGAVRHPRRARARRRLPVRLPAAARPSRGAQRRRDGAGRARSPAAPRPRSPANAASRARRPRRRSPRRGGAPLPTRPRPTTTRRSRWRPRRT